MKSEEKKGPEKIEEVMQQPEPPLKLVGRYYPEVYSALLKEVTAGGPQQAVGRIAVAEMDLVAHRNNMLYMSEALTRMDARLERAEARLKKEQESCKHWFHMADDLEQENIELKSEIRKLKNKGKGKEKKS